MFIPPPQYNIYIDQGNWTIPGSAFSDYIVSTLMGSPVDLYPNVAILMNDVMIENNQIYVQTRPPGIYKFYYTEISGSGNYNKVGYVVVSESANVVQGECCPTDCNWVCNNSFTEFPIYACENPLESILTNSGIKYYITTQQVILIDENYAKVNVVINTG